ncbi:polysaccharide deacetylase family protein [Eudoraea chungangensis]|uniref:polysaccharide deacetylase family protein n=1 Tax=Eudoraea chungangensis TaxID=1481905 RepID=UPI0023EBCB8C|nr:polysaccharide deacetylase family protein [Eudoraea chungangensis]
MKLSPYYNSVFIVLAFFIVKQSFSQISNIAERLGFPKESKLLIVHADDLGVANSENMASIYALENSPVNSASIMVPCPWFPEIAAYARENKNMDFGLHLTLNSEWQNYKWGPVSSKDRVKSLINEEGYFFSSVDSLATYAKPEEVEIELRGQIEKALAAGINITHLDTHMGSAASTPEIGIIYIKLGREYKIPVLLDGRIMETPMPGLEGLLDKNTVMVDNIHIAYPNAIKQGMDVYYRNILKNLPAGLNCLLIHAAYDNAEMKAITINHPEYGSAWRQADFDFFTSKECAKILEDENIILVSWKELRDKITRSE